MAKEEPIETLEKLKAAYPTLVEQHDKELRSFIKGYSVAQFKKQFPELYADIATAVQDKIKSTLKADGFVLEIDDPFAAGALRTFGKLKDEEGLRLPYVLPFKHPHSRGALESYIVRASGGGDRGRVEAARSALEKCK